MSIPPLAGRHVRLDPMTPTSAPALLAAAAADRSTYGLTRVPDSMEEMQAYVDRALADHAAGTAVPYLVATPSGEVVGSTRFLDIECWPEFDRSAPTVAEIGHTWLARSVQRTAVNTEMKLLMLTHAFETWRVLRVTLKTDARNERSRAAIARIGASFEGVRRRHMMASDGTVRDSAYYSIVDSEWAAAKEVLVQRLAADG
ncbi:MAG: GNAT family protein [Actinomycetota bacterium]